MPEPRSTPTRSPRWLRLGSRVFRVGLALGVLIGAAGIFAALRVTRPQPEQTVREAEVPRVVTMTAEPTPVHRRWPGHGTARAMRAIDVAAQVAARVDHRPPEIEEGVRVERGQLLVQLDSSDFEEEVRTGEQRLARLRADRKATATVESLKAQLAAAGEDLRLQERDLERVRTALENGAANQTDVDRQRAAVERARQEVARLQQSLDVVPAQLESLDAQIRGEQSALETARRNLERTSITAPIDGVLQSLSVEAGEWVGVGATVARVVDLARLEVPLQVPVAAARSISAGDRVELSSDGGDERRWRGTVARVAPEADERTRSLTAYVEITQDLPPAPDQPRSFGEASGLMLPGEYVEGRIRTGSGAERLLVPRRVVSEDRVYVVERETIEGTPVERVREAPVQVAFHVEGSFPGLDPLETQWAVIERGLEAGDRVVISNLGELLPGRRVEAATRADDRRSARDETEPTG